MSTYKRFGKLLAWTIGAFMVWTIARIWAKDLHRVTLTKLLLPLAIVLAGVSGLFGDSKNIMILSMGGLLLYITVVMLKRFKFDSKLLMLWQAGTMMAIIASIVVKLKVVSLAGLVLGAVFMGFAGHMLVFPERWKYDCSGTGRHRCSYRLKE